MSPMPGEKSMGAIPSHIKKARLEGNTDLLSAAGRKGAQEVARRKAARAIEDEMVAVKRAEEIKESLKLNREALGKDNVPFSALD
jgi:hypothetical protein